MRYPMEIKLEAPPFFDGIEIRIDLPRRTTVGPGMAQSALLFFFLVSIVGTESSKLVRNRVS